VGELIAVVFVDIERLILNLPARASDLDDHGDSGGLDVQVGNPTIVLEQVPFGGLFPDFPLGHAHRALQR
jgi:hypothetical protein